MKARRQQLCHEGTVKLRVYLEGTRLSAAEDSPYHLEISIANQSRKPVVRGGFGLRGIAMRRAVDAVRLTNQSEPTVAATLTIDGLNTVRVQRTQGLQLRDLLPQQSAEIQGWHRTPMNRMRLK